MKTDIKGIIFDLDGVICHTDIYHYRAWKQMADGEGIEFNEKINERLRGVSRAQSLEIILEKASKTYSQEEKSAMMELKNNLYREQLKQMTPQDLAPEVLTTLNNLRGKGFRLAIGSSSKNAGFILDRIGLGTFFDAVSDGNNIRRSKPDPQVFLMAAQMLELDPSVCLVIEDAQAGIDAAIAGGFHNAGIGTAAGYEKSEFKLNSFSDIEAILS